MISEHPPTDKKWSKYDNLLLEHISNGDWGFYRNTRFEMGEFLRKEGGNNDALLTFLEVCYLDLDGPSNGNKTKGAELLKDFPPFNPKEGFLAPGIIKRIKSIIKKLDLNLGEVKSLYLSHTTKIKTNLKLSVDLEKSWLKIKKELLR